MRTAGKKEAAFEAKAKVFLKEIKKAVDKAVKSFSVARAVGLKTEADNDESEESEDENSLEFMDALGHEKVIGPYVPTENRIIIAQTLQKMESLWNEKKQIKASALLEWRLKTAYQKLGQVKNHNDALFALHKLSERRKAVVFNCVAVKAAANKATGDSKDENPYFNLTKPSDIPEYNPHIRESFVIDRKVVTDPNFAQAQELVKLKREIENLRQVVKQKDLLIKSLESEKSELLNERDEAYSQVLDSPMDKQITTMNSGRDRQNGKSNVMGSSMLNKKATTSPLISSESPVHRQLEEMQKMVYSLENELAVAKRGVAKQSSSTAQTQNGTSASIKMQNSTSDLDLGSDRPKKEAGLRIKGRLLAVLREKYHGAPVRRSFLRWAVFVNKNFLRDCITKVAVNCRLTHQTALWRFVKMVPRNIKVKMSEAAKNMQYVRASSMIELLIKINNLICTVHSMNKMRPGVVGKFNRKLIDLLIKKARNEQTAKLSSFYKLVKDHKIKKDAIKRLIEAYDSKVAHAMRTIRDNHATAVMADRLAMVDPDYSEAVDILSRVAKRHIVASIMSDKHDKLERMLESIAKMIERQQQKAKSDALRQVSSNMHATKLEEAGLKASKQVENLKLSSFMNKLVNSQEAKMSRSIDGMRVTAIKGKHADDADMAMRDIARQRKDDLLRSLLRKAVQSWKLRQKDIFDKLGQNVVTGSAEEQVSMLRAIMTENSKKNKDELKKAYISGLMKALQNAEKRVLQKALDALREITKAIAAEEMQRQKDEEAKTAARRKAMLSCLNKMLHGASEQKSSTLSKLLLHKNKSIYNEELAKAQDQIEQVTTKRLKRNIFELLKLAQLGKTKEAYFILSQLSGHIEHKDIISRLNDQTISQLKNIVLSSSFNRLIKSHQAKQRLVFRKFIDASTLIEQAQKQKSDLMKKFAERMLTNRSYLTGNAMGKLRLFNAEAAQEEERARVENEKIENKKKMMKKTLLKDLIKAQKSKQSHAIDDFKDNLMHAVEAEEFNRIKEEAAKRLSKEIVSKILDKIKRAYDAKGKEMLHALNENSKLIMIDEQMKKSKSQTVKASLQNFNRLLGGRIGLENDVCLKEAFEKIKGFSYEKQLELAQSTIESLKAQFNKKGLSIRTLEKLRAASQAKQQEALAGLKTLTVLCVSEEAHQKDLNNLKDKIKKKSVSFALNRIADAQSFRIGNALSSILEYSRRISKREKMLNDLLIRGQVGKLRNALEKLRNLNNHLQSHNMMQKALEEAQVAILQAEEEQMKTKKIDFLHLLKRAQDTKAIDALRNLRKIQKETKYQEEIAKRISEAEDMLKNRKLKAILSKLKMAQQEKNSHAIASLKENSKEIEVANALRAADEQRKEIIKDKVMRHLKHYLENRGYSRLQEALSTLKNHNQEMAQEEARRKLAGKTLLAGLVRSYCSKVKDALTLLNTESLKLINQEVVESNKQCKLENEEKLAEFEAQLLKKKEDLLIGRLAAAHIAKQRLCFSRIKAEAQKYRALEAEYELREKLAEQAKLHNKQNILKKLMGGNQGKLLEALRLLRENNAIELAKMTEMERQEYENNKNKCDLLRDLIHAQESKMLSALQRVQRQVALLAGKSKEEKKAKLLSDLIKQTNLKTQSALKKLILEEMCLAAQAQKDKFKLIGMLKMLQGGQEDKAQAALSKLLQHSRKDGQDELINKSNKKNILEKLMSLASQSLLKSRENCYIRLAQHTSASRRDAGIRRQLLSRLIKATTAKMQAAIDRHVTASLQISAVDMANRTHMEMMQEKEMLFKRAAIDKIVNAMHAKQGDGMGALRDHFMEKVLREKEKEKVAQQLANTLRRSWSDARIKAYKLMVKYTEIKRLIEERQEIKLEDMLRKLQNAIVGKTNGVFNRLKDNSQIEKLDEVKKAKCLGSLFKNLDDAYDQKLSEAFSKLLHNNVLVDSASTRAKHFKTVLIKKLVERQKAKQSVAFDCMEDHKKDAYELEKHRNDLIKQLARRLGDGSSGKLFDSFFAMRNHAKDSELAVVRNRMKLSRLVENLIPAQLRKQNEALGSLRLYSIKEVQSQKERAVSRIICFKKLVAAQNGKCREALQEFSRFIDEHQSRAKNAKDKLSYLIHKINAGYGGKLYDAMHILIEKNNTERRYLRDMRASMIYLLNKLAASHFSKMTEAFNKMSITAPTGKSAKELAQEAKEALLKKLVANSLSEIR